MSYKHTIGIFVPLGLLVLIGGIIGAALEINHTYRIGYIIGGMCLGISIILGGLIAADIQYKNRNQLLLPMT